MLEIAPAIVLSGYLAFKDARSGKCPNWALNALLILGIGVAVLHVFSGSCNVSSLYATLNFLGAMLLLFSKRLGVGKADRRYLLAILLCCFDKSLREPFLLEILGNSLFLLALFSYLKRVPRFLPVFASAFLLPWWIRVLVCLPSLFLIGKNGSVFMPFLVGGFLSTLAGIDFLGVSYAGG